MQRAEHLQDAGDLAARGRFFPLAARALQIRAEIALSRILERQAVERRAVVAHDDEGVVDRDRARVAVEQLAEVGLADPARRCGG